MLGRARLFTGLLLFAFVSSHLLHHALSLLSLQALETGRVWFLLLWRNPVGTIVLYGAGGLHLALTA